MICKPIIENNLFIKNIEFPTSIMIKLTNACNVTCYFCSQGIAGNIFLDKSIILKLQNEAKKYGVVDLIYSGGEPLLYPSIDEVIRNGYELGLSQKLVTNGINLKNIKPTTIQMFDNIGISIHGDENIHDFIVGKKGTYKKVLESLEYINDLPAKPEIIINFTLTNENVNCLDHIMEISEKFNCHVSVARLNRIGKSSNITNISEIIFDFFESNTFNTFKMSNVIPPCQVGKKYRSFCHSCSAGIASVCIEANGEVKICASSSQIYGSIYEDDLFEIWNNPKFKEFRSLEWLPITCKVCRQLSQCLGGCKAEHKIKGFTYDELLFNDIINFSKKCKNERICFSFTNIRKIDESYLILDYPNRILDKEGFLLIQQLLNIENFENFLKTYPPKKQREIIDFLYLLYKEGLLQFEEK